ncbi:MAG TPA: hypothetical protein VI423_02875 [Paenisporosarcina sp.]|nr:hypothetical protein [Paenisporosarcina sp.]
MLTNGYYQLQSLTVVYYRLKMLFTGFPAKKQPKDLALFWFEY